MSYYNSNRRSYRVLSNERMNALKREKKMSGYDIARMLRPKIKPRQLVTDKPVEKTVAL